MSTAPHPSEPYNGEESAREAPWVYDAPNDDGVEYLEESYSDGNAVEYAPKKQVMGAIDGVDTAQTHISQMDETRAARVAKRRHATTCIGRFMNRIVPYGGLLSSGFNLASSSIGAGIISLPSAFESSGLGMAIIYLVVIAVLTVYSYTLLAIAANRTGLRNYEQIVQMLMGNGAGYFPAFCLWLLSFGAEVSYVISLGDVMTAFLTNASNTPAYLLTKSGQRLITSMMWLVLMLPLCLLREINSLRHFSMVAISLIIFFVICMIVHSAQNGLKHGVRDDLIYFQTGNTAVMGLSIFMFAFISQLNCYEVYNEMYKPTVLRLTLGAGLGTFLCFILYFMAGLFGYMDFGPAVTGSSLKMYNPVKEPLMGVGYVGIMLKLCVGYGLHMIPVREAIYYVCQIDPHTVSWLKNAIVCTTMAVLSLIAGLFIPRINMVFGLVGGFSGGFIGYVFPALMFMYTGDWTVKTVGWFNYLGTYFLLITGVIGVVWGTAAAIYSEAIQH